MVDFGVVCEGAAELVELGDELQVEEVERRVVEGHPGDVLVDPYFERGEVVVVHVVSGGVGQEVGSFAVLVAVQNAGAKELVA
jgi:hypothetical protein